MKKGALAVISDTLWHDNSLPPLQQPTSEAFFKIKFIYFLDTLILQYRHLYTKNINFRRDLSEISANENFTAARAQLEQWHDR